VPLSLDELNAYSRDHLPELVGFEVTHAEPGILRARMAVQQKLLAPNGFLHAASIIALADSACGFGTYFDLPEQASGFTTIELKSNFLGTAKSGVLRCEAKRMHFGKSTQVWDAVVQADSDRTIALFRCTQMILTKRSA
jgi:1,4-dihydroxy-2-naphthoyl-CoA hydrolase